MFCRLYDEACGLFLCKILVTTSRHIPTLHGSHNAESIEARLVNCAVIVIVVLLDCMKIAR